MKLGFFSLCLALVLAVVLGQEEINSQSEFSALADDGRHAFVKFYAPWCGHCKRLAPTWTELAKKYEGHEKVRILKVDCTQQKQICNANGVRGYPTLKLFKEGSGEGEKYQGKRAVEDFDKFIQQYL